MSIKTIDLYATLSPEYLISVGNAAGMGYEATEHFRHFSEVGIEARVDTDTGCVLEISLKPPTEWDCGGQ